MSSAFSLSSSKSAKTAPLDEKPLLEDDSAKARAVAGLSVVGRQKYGVFPLRGKPLNVRDASLKRVGENDELMNLMRALGYYPSEAQVSNMVNELQPSDQWAIKQPWKKLDDALLQFHK